MKRTGMTKFANFCRRGDAGVLSLPSISALAGTLE